MVLPASHSLVGAAPDVYFGVLEGIGYGHIQTLAAMSFFVGQQVWVYLLVFDLFDDGEVCCESQPWDLVSFLLLSPSNV